MKLHKNAIKSKNRREFWFALGIVAVPILWWAWTFVYTTSDSIALAFKTWDYGEAKYVFTGFDTFKRTFSELFSGGNLVNTALVNSVLLWLVQLLIAIPIAVIVSFALYKNVYFSGAFKIILFLPQIISSMVWILAFQFILNKLGLGSLLKADSNVSKYTLLFYSLWLGFAGNMVMYTGAMSRVPPSLVEAGHLDGMTDLKEFWYIVIPLIFPTLSVILITCVMSIFTITIPAFSFFGYKELTYESSNHLYTFGLYTFMKGLGDKDNIPVISALSMITCIIAAPVTLGVKSLLNKIGPTVEY